MGKVSNLSVGMLSPSMILLLLDERQVGGIVSRVLRETSEYVSYSCFLTVDMIKSTSKGKSSITLSNKVLPRFIVNDAEGSVAYTFPISGPNRLSRPEMLDVFSSILLIS